MILSKEQKEHYLQSFAILGDYLLSALIVGV
jgi:hypothetical protein